MNPRNAELVDPSTDPVLPHQPAESLTLSVAEAAGLLGISRALAYDLVRTGDIPAIRLGRRLVVPRHALFDLLGPKQEP
jgi:excisionase family DNA binding protein